MLATHDTDEQLSQVWAERLQTWPLGHTGHAGVSRQMTQPLALRDF